MQLNIAEQEISKDPHLEQNITDILIELGEDTHRSGLQKTPQRVAKSLRYLTRGYHQDLTAIINGAIFPSTMSEMVLVKDIEIYSLCEHHLLPFFGKCHIGYIPNGKIMGISKFARIADLFARRLQVQEKLTEQIAECVQKATGASGVGVIIDAKHLCMMMRGVEKQNSSMKTSKMLGCFKDDQRTRAEFLSLVNL